MNPAYQQLQQQLAEFIPGERLIADPLRTLAYGTDASFYRLIPQLVVKVLDEVEMQLVLRAAGECATPVTFRAAGTSLSGQAITDSVLLVPTGEGWSGCELARQDAGIIRLQPGVIGARANNLLAPYHRKIGPDPASINAAKIGGIAANNASGMCCGTAQNSYHTLKSMRVILADGTLLDTASPQSLAAFRESHGALLAGLEALALETRENRTLADRIRHKYRLKNTTGYSLNALVDFQDPVEILQHLMIGSEGTLGFISEICYRTVPDHPCKATSLVLFPDIETACGAVAALKQAPVTALELMDRAALRSVERKPGMPEFLAGLGEDVAALLVDARAEDQAGLTREVEEISTVLDGIETVMPVSFSFDPAAYHSLWNIRKGLFPAVGAVRETGTTVIIEDVAFPVERLAAAVRELQGLFDKYGYNEALIFGHALEGNLHFVFTQDFGPEAEVARYQKLMDEVCRMVVESYGGSLKAEHGTGRNMAPYVEMEWGSDAYRLMWEIKRLFDPDNLLNPGVILNSDQQIHLKHLKALPRADELVDKCIECGFCEAVCPSRDLTLTPRQRIVSWREISRLRDGDGERERLADLERAFQYQGLESCAVDGLCAIRCPVEIDTGKLTKKIRAGQRGTTALRVAKLVNDRFAGVTSGVRAGLAAAGLAQDLLGDRVMGTLARTARRVSGGRLPGWSPHLPRRSSRLAMPAAGPSPGNGELVYFPSCVCRTMGPAKGDPHQDPLHARILKLLAKAGFQARYPAGVDGHCCGMALASKGLPDEAESGLRRLEQALWDSSDAGRLPILCDTSPCTLRMREVFQQPMQIFEPAEMISRYLLPHLSRVRQLESVALHVTCSSRKMGLDGLMFDLAKQCAKEVLVSEEQGCCGFSGDKGFTHPELNASALGHLKRELGGRCSRGFSNSRTCEIGLSQHAGIPYQSIVYLVDECHQSRPDGD